MAEIQLAGTKRPNPGVKLRSPFSPTAIVILVVAAMGACVLGLVVWKALDARNAALAQGERDIRNLTHSLAEQATRSIQATDVALSGMVDLLKYQRPRSDRFELFMRNTVKALPQIREIAVLDASGAWIYSSLAETPQHNNSDRNYFIYHRDSEDPAIRIGEPLQSRLTGRSTIILSKRIANPDGGFGGVVIAAIDSNYFDNSYKAFKFGAHAGITLLHGDGVVLAHWPAASWNGEAPISSAFKTLIKQVASGYSKIRSPFDGYLKYVGFERSSLYPLVMTVALTEDELLAGWLGDLRLDAIVAGVLLCSTALLAILLSSQFRSRARIEIALREREARYRLLADNIADVVLLLDRGGTILFVSQSVEAVLGLKPDDMVGRSCFNFVHPDDLDLVSAATTGLTRRTSATTATLRTFRGDGSIAWIEINFRVAGVPDDHQQLEVVGVLRDVTQRRMMEDELKALNVRLAELATTDGLTGLANRRSFDAALRREYGHWEQISVMLLDIDNFKGFNDSLGHQAGDLCLQRVAGVIAEATRNTAGLSARYGGEEFAVILPGIGEQDALKVAEAIRLTIRSLAIANPAASRGYLSISVGIAGRMLDTGNETQLVGDADLALYEAKRRGRNRSIVSSALKQHHGSEAEAQSVCMG